MGKTITTEDKNMHDHRINENGILVVGIAGLKFLLVPVWTFVSKFMMECAK